MCRSGRPCKGPPPASGLSGLTCSTDVHCCGDNTSGWLERCATPDVTAKYRPVGDLTKPLRTAALSGYGLSAVTRIWSPRSRYSPL
jgi:hypothetical protein